MRTPMLVLVTCLLCAGLLGCLQTGKQSVQFEARISSLEQDVRQLERELENERQARQEQDKALRQAIDARSISQEAEERPGDNATLDTEADDQAQTELTDQANATALTSGQQKQAREEAAEATSGQAREQYQKALDTLLSGNPMRSQKMFKQFIDQHPQSPLLPNAYYWLGESYYVQKQFAQSILAFKEVSNQFPDDPKASDALLKMGYAYANLDQDSNARFYLKTLVKKYPDSKSAKLAQKRLDNLGSP
jgi:tol-pal system protein YbgF